MDDVLIELEAVAPSANRFRRWRIEFARDMFGVLTAQVSFGRIGCSGRTRQWAFHDAARATWFLRTKLNRRATSPQRIGARYQIIDASVSAWPFLDAAGLHRAEDAPAIAVAEGEAGRMAETTRATGNRPRRSVGPRPATLV